VTPDTASNNTAVMKTDWTFLPTDQSETDQAAQHSSLIVTHSLVTTSIMSDAF